MKFVLPYGAAALDAARVILADDGAVSCPSPHVVIDTVATGMLRLNSGQYAFPEAPDLRTMTDATIQAEYLRHHLSGFCDLWNKPAARFLQSYFEFVAGEVESQKPELSASNRRSSPSSTCPNAEDWRQLCSTAQIPVESSLL